MKTKHIIKKLKQLFSKCSSLILLFQRSPLIQMLLPEAKVLGTAGVLDTVTLGIATVAGLGAYDTVAGATTITQLFPNASSASYNAAMSSPMSMGITISGIYTPSFWLISAGSLPTGVTIKGSTSNMKNATIAGTPTATGISPITVRAGDGDNFREDTFTINYDPVAVITTHPASISINSGTTTTLSVSAARGNGTGAFSYQWYQGTSPSITTPVGTNSASFTTPTLNTAASYWVKVTRTMATLNSVYANSNTATVSISSGTPASISTNPVSTTINSGRTATLTVVAAGTAPFTYQWYQGPLNNMTSPVGTSSSYTTVPLSINTSYWVKVTNAANPAGAISTLATVTVNQPAAITSSPTSVTINAGETTQLSVTASGTAPFSYQWYQGDSPNTGISVGSNSNIFTTPALSISTNYWVNVSNNANVTGANSAHAVVTVLPLLTTWKNSIFNSTQLANSTISGDAADPDGDNITNINEYIYGTSPLVAQSSLLTTATPALEQFQISFTARAATGSGYFGKTRHYALETQSDLSGTWNLLAGYENIIATGQQVNATVPTNLTKGFYRMRAWLTP
jgi:hypothetical protein